MSDDTPTDLPGEAETAPPCLSCGKPSVWTSPTGHHLCEECRTAYDRRFPPTSDTLAELLERDLEPIRWTVEEMIPEGLTFLAGKTKLGKSYLVLGLALAVASGQPFLNYRTHRGAVLYIALEDGERRIQSRALWLGAGKMDGLDQFHYRTQWPSLDHGGLDQLEQWIVDYPDTQLIIVDTFGRLRGEVAGRDRYAEEYAVLGRLQGFAIKNRIALVIVHHLRKQSADDWLEGLSGSQAVTGAADTILGLYRDRGQADAVLRTVSRDADEFEVALQFNDGRWTYLGPAADYRHSIDRQAVLDALRDLGGEAKVSEIASLVDKTAANTSKLLIKLAADGAVHKTKYGVYSLVEVVEVVELHPSESLSTPVEVVEQLNFTPPTSPTSTTSTYLHEGDLLLADQEETLTPAESDDYDPDPDDLPNPFGDD